LRRVSASAALPASTGGCIARRLNRGHAGDGNPTAPGTADEEAQMTQDMELLKLRFDYAWKHFDFHARQRTTMFQYFATMLPLIVAAYFYFLKEKPLHLVDEALLTIALIGVILSIVFCLLDVRNRQLYRISESNLMLLEKNYLYKVPLDGFPGIVTYEQRIYGDSWRHRALRFRFLITLIYFGSAALFLALAILAIGLHSGRL
jgi:hypothetical protein